VRELVSAARARLASPRAGVDRGEDRALAAMAAEIRAGTRRSWRPTPATSAQAKADGADAAFIDRLTLTPQLVEQNGAGVEQVAALPTRWGRSPTESNGPSGIEVGTHCALPLGVVGIIYESRPNVTADAAAALREGRQRLHPARRLRSARVRTARSPPACGGPEERAPARGRGRSSSASPTARRSARWCGCAVVDIIVPRGGKELIERLSRESQIPMNQALDGVCHVYVRRPGRPPRWRCASPTTAKTQR